MMITIILTMMNIFVADVYSMQCYECWDIDTPVICNTTVSCNDDQSCFLLSKDSPSGIQYDMGCWDNSFCLPHGVVTVVGREEKTKRGTEACLECCSESGCNSHLCSDAIPSDCFDIKTKTHTTVNGLYKVKPAGLNKTIQVYCDMQTDGGGWTVFQHRVNGDVDFYKTFAEYEAGFGNNEDFWLALPYIHAMSSAAPSELRIDLTKPNGSHAYGLWTHFYLTAGPQYALIIDHGTGTLEVYKDHNGNKDIAFGRQKYDVKRVCVPAMLTLTYKIDVDTGYSFHRILGDDLSFNGGQPFQTKDKDVRGCAVGYHGAWWYWGCTHVNLNGPYAEPGTIAPYYGGDGGMIWHSFTGQFSLKTTKMMFRKM